MSANPDLRRRGQLGQWQSGALLAAILLLALGLRLWQLDAHPLWWDEGNNAYFAHASPGRILEMSRLTNDTNPPLHRLALGLWLRVLGDSARNLRLLSVLCGVATVALAYAWGARLGGASAGLLAALLLALAPNAIYYSREAKGYPWVTLWEWLALTLLVRATEEQAPGTGGRARWGSWIAYTAASILAVGAHYYALFVHLTQGVWLVGGLAWHWPGRREAWRRLGPWALAQALVLAAVAPWALLTWGTAYAGAEAIPLEAGTTSPFGYLAGMLTRLAAGPHPRSPWGAVSALALVALALWGLWSSHGDGRRLRLAALAGCVLAVPITIGYAVQWVGIIVIPRLLLFTVPALCILAALGIARLRWRVLPLALVLAVAWGMCLPGAYASPALPGEDIRELAATLDAYARPGDAAIVSYIWQEGMLRVYAPQAPVEWVLGWYTDETVAQDLERLLAEHGRLWLLSYDQPLQHPSNQAGWWLEQHAVRVLAQEQGKTRLVLYTRGCEGQGGLSTYSFEGGIVLHSAAPQEAASAGDVLSLALSWTLAEPMPAGTTIFLQLLGPDGALVAQSDGDPLNGLAPLAAQPAGKPVQDCRALLVPASAAPGTYTVIAGLYDRGTGHRVPVVREDGSTSDHAVLGSVEIVERSGPSDQETSRYGPFARVRRDERGSPSGTLPRTRDEHGRTTR